MGEAQQRGDMEEFRRLGAEAHAIAYSPEMNRKTAQLLISAGYLAAGYDHETTNLRVANKRLQAQLDAAKRKLDAAKRKLDAAGRNG